MQLELPGLRRQCFGEVCELGHWQVLAKLRKPGSNFSTAVLAVVWAVKRIPTGVIVIIAPTPGSTSVHRPSALCML
jgi:hypothetical protein